MQKEQLSALMDGELIDSEFIGSLSQDNGLQQYWRRYHLVRDTLRGDIGQTVHVDVAANVFAAIEHEDNLPIPFIKDAQPRPEVWHKFPFWQKIKPWFSQVGQAGIAAGVSLAVIVGVQQYNGSEQNQTDVLPFSTFAIGNMTSPVSYGITPNAGQSNIQDHRRHFAILQDYELQRRMNAEPLDITEMKQAEPVTADSDARVINN